MAQIQVVRNFWSSCPHSQMRKWKQSPLLSSAPCGLSAPGGPWPGALWERPASLSEEDSKDLSGQHSTWGGAWGGSRERGWLGRRRGREKVCSRPRRASCLLGKPRHCFQNEGQTYQLQDKLPENLSLWANTGGSVQRGKTPPQTPASTWGPSTE